MFFLNYKRRLRVEASRRVLRSTTASIVTLTMAGSFLAMSPRDLSAGNWNFGWGDADGLNVTGMFGYETGTGGGVIDRTELDYFMVTFREGSTDRATFALEDLNVYGNAFRFRVADGQLLDGDNSNYSSPNYWRFMGGSYSFSSLATPNGNFTYINLGLSAYLRIFCDDGSTPEDDCDIVEEPKATVPIPEPSTYALMSAMVVIPVLARKRKLAAAKRN